MLKKMSIQLRLTVLSVLLLTVCCVGLTIILNVSASRMADVIETIPLITAQMAQPGEVLLEEMNTIEQMPITKAETSQGARSEFLKNSIFYVVFVVIIGGGMTYYLSGKALQPLKALSVQMNNRTVHNLSEDLPMPESRDEIADLTCAFNEMSRKLDDAFAMQKRFSQSAAHELRTPLAILKTKVEVFKKKKEHTPEAYDKLLCVIITQTNRLGDLVRDLLSLTNRDELLGNEPVELKDMLSDICNELSEIAKDKHINVIVCGQKSIVQGSQSLLHRAFYNLIENAIKYNVEGGKVIVEMSKSEEHTVISIADTGIGIPVNLQELIFEPFFRVDKSRSRQMGGAGLGLSIVKSIVDKHHGQLKVSNNLGGGTIFEVIL
ncbi:MAG: sensor histidine kinase [Cellulosilyticaceae bacterium]